MNTSRSLTVIDKSRKRLGRWLLVTAMISTLSLQVIAADHWHGIEDTQHCEICLHAYDAPLYESPVSFAVLGRQQIQRLGSIPAYTADTKPGAGNRDPPKLS